MHEAGLISTVLAAAVARAEKMGGRPIRVVTLKIGPLSGVVPDALEFAFDSLKKKTLAADAVLRVNTAPIVCGCRNCGKEFTPKEFLDRCPNCEAREIEVRHGAEMELESMEVI